MARADKRPQNWTRLKKWGRAPQIRDDSGGWVQVEGPYGTPALASSLECTLNRNDLS
jgi:hypothetical protein